VIPDHSGTDADLVRGATSFLFVPGDRPDRFDKANRSGASVVIVDLEDAVATQDKSVARAAVTDWLTHGGRACVRINAAGTRHHDDDVAALADMPGLVAVMLPKADAESTAEVVNRCPVPVVALIESAAGIATAPQIAAHSGVSRIAFGHLDYALDIGANPTRTAMLTARSALVLASRLAGLPGPIDGVTTVLDDPDTLAADLHHAQELGMTGKLLIHPAQVVVTNAAFRPDHDAVRWAEGVVAAGRAGRAVSVNGEMVDAPVLARAHAILRRSS
jgi:citrate lyase subunit beta/citryl-CoA lyase